MSEAALVSAFHTSRKVYAEGARVSETPLNIPQSKIVEKGEASISVPNLRRPRRKMFRKLDCAIPGYAPICLDSNDPQTVECGFKQRLLRDLPPANFSKLHRFKEFVRKFLKENVPKAEPMSFEEWLDSSSYNQERKNQLRAAHDELRGGRPSAKKCSHIDTFVKSEFYPTWKHARMINSRSDVFKAFVGPKFKAIEKVVFALKWFIKHTPVALRPAKIRELKKAGRRYFVTDFTAFESHFIPLFMDACECELYRWCLSDDADVDFICRVIMGSNRMRTRTGIRAQVRGRRMSGEMSTSVSNGFSNLMLAMFEVEEKGGVFEGYVEGDDGIFSTDVELTAEDYADLGFTIKIEEVDDPCTASFCGMIFAESGEIIKEPRKFLQGFGWTQSFIHAGDRIMKELLRAKALSSVYETPQCPIIGALSRYALEITRGCVPRFVEDGFHNVPKDEGELAPFSPSSDTRHLFERTFGIGVSAQLAIESALSSGRFDDVQVFLPPTDEQMDYCSKFVVVT